MSEHHPVGSVQPEMGASFWVVTSVLVMSALVLLLTLL
jgi:hypothetical protein